MARWSRLMKRTLIQFVSPCVLLALPLAKGWRAREEEEGKGDVRIKSNRYQACTRLAYLQSVISLFTLLAITAEGG